MFRSILIPVDLADIDSARPAMAAAVELAKVSSGSLRLLHVMTMIPVMYLEYVPIEYNANARESALAELTTLAQGLDLPADRVSVAVRTGGVYAEVLDEATAMGADLIVVGSHRPGMATYLLGSNATTIVRHATCSVLVMRH